MKAVTTCVCAGLLLAGCAGTPIYRPAPTPNDYGYRATALTDSHYRVSFAGGYGVARETVENLALFRAAQVALSHGSRRLLVISSESTSITDYAGPTTSFGFGFGYPFWTTGIGVSPGYADTRYETVLEIKIGPDVPRQGARTYDALELKRHLAGIAHSARN